MSTQYKGKGPFQTTGSMNTMPNLSTSSLSPLSTITLNGSTGWPSNVASSLNYNTISLGLESFNRHPDVKKYEVYESPEDVIVLAVTWKRLRDAGIYGKVSKLMDNFLFGEITHVDREKASVIRDYYSKKIMMWNLKGIKLTRYREDLAKLIQGDGTILREDQMGIAYHLPMFYEYDQSFEEIRLVTNYKELKHRTEGVVELEPVKRMFRKTRSSLSHEYWFKTKNTGHPVRLSLNVKNPLQHIWDAIFDTSKVLQIEATMIRKETDGFEYYLVCDKWELKNG
jgi:hypothetical protein